MTASRPDHACGDREIEAWRGLLEIFALTLEASLERTHIPGPQPAGNCELRRGGEHSGDVHRHKCIHGVETGEQHDQRGAGPFPKTVSAHVHRRLGSPLGRLGQRRVEELVAGPEDRRAQRHIEAARKNGAPWRRGNEAKHAGRAHQQRVAGHRASEPDPGEDRAAEHGLEQERGKGRPRVEEAEEAHQRLAFSKPARRPPP